MLGHGAFTTAGKAINCDVDLLLHAAKIHRVHFWVLLFGTVSSIFTFTQQQELPLQSEKIDMRYPEELVVPMREELTNAGFTQLKTTEEVKDAISQDGTTLVVVNSVCGCAAGTARPGVVLSLTAEKKPDNLTTVFAGMEMEATNTAREMMMPYPPSSPSIALFKDGELVHMIERHHIEGRSAQMIAQNLAQAYVEHC